MSFELVDRIRKELSITSHALYEAVLAISERVNRKVYIMRLHWRASSILASMDEVTHALGQQIATSLSHRMADRSVKSTDLSNLDTSVTWAHQRIQDLKRALLGIDTEIRQLKLETIHADLLRLQQDLSMRSAGIERITIPRGAAVIGQTVHDVPRSPAMFIATVIRGPFLLDPSKDLVFRIGDIVILIGEQTELDHLTQWFTSTRRTKAAIPQSA